MHLGLKGRLEPHVISLSYFWFRFFFFGFVFSFFLFFSPFHPISDAQGHYSIHPRQKRSHRASSVQTHHHPPPSFLPPTLLLSSLLFCSNPEDIGTSSPPLCPETWIYGFIRSGFAGGGFCFWWVFSRTIWAPCWTARRPAAALKQRSIAISPTTAGFSLYSPCKTLGAMGPALT